MPGWDSTKCVNGYPDPFTEQDAETVVNSADFSAPVQVIKSNSGETRTAYTYVEYKGYKLCVGGHIHLNPDGSYKGPGNSFICGYAKWEMLTPDPATKVIAGYTKDSGTFPGNDRYPRRIT
ncbi:hypothetical protein [Streptomyces sp. CRN 30]|uniref:hypothetical protein n=1 Tax=Streptomyces sp. CRN 30 TaxID=3075613 RepID=UPI002A808BA5|nr:hypothetical protein [Streptomyces sp. CRN 30]